MFDSVFTEDASARLRYAAAAPLASFLITLGYLTFYPLLPRVPAFLFWSVVVILAAGAIAGAVNILRVVRNEKIRGRAIGWLTGAAALTLLCAWLAITLTLPWL